MVHNASDRFCRLVISDTLHPNVRGCPMCASARLCMYIYHIRSRGSLPAKKKTVRGDLGIQIVRKITISLHKKNMMTLIIQKLAYNSLRHFCTMDTRDCPRQEDRNILCTHTSVDMVAVPQSSDLLCTPHRAYCHHYRRCPPPRWTHWPLRVSPPHWTH